MLFLLYALFGKVPHPKFITCVTASLPERQIVEGVYVLPLIIVSLALIIQALNHFCVTTANETGDDNKVPYSVHVIFLWCSSWPLNNFCNQHSRCLSALQIKCKALSSIIYEHYTSLNFKWLINQSGHFPHIPGKVTYFEHYLTTLTHRCAS